MDTRVGGSKWLAERIAARRQQVLLLTRAGMTQGELAVLLGVERKTVLRDLRAVRAHLAAIPPLDVAALTRQAHAQLDEDEAALRGRLVDAPAREARWIYQQIGALQDRRARWLGFAKAAPKSDRMPQWLSEALDAVEAEPPPRLGAARAAGAAATAAVPGWGGVPGGSPADAAAPGDGADTGDAGEVLDEVVDGRPGRAGRVVDGGRGSGGGVTAGGGGPGGSGRVAGGSAALTPRRSPAFGRAARGSGGGGGAVAAQADQA